MEKRTWPVVLLLLAMGLAAAVIARKCSPPVVSEAVFAGRVVDANRRPQPRLRIVFVAADPERGVAGPLGEATARDDGAFAVRLPFTRVRARVPMRPFAAGAVTEFDLAASRTQVLELVVLAEADWPPVRGRVVDQRGQPVVDAAVADADPASPGTDSRTDEAGVFVLPRPADHASPWIEIAASHADHDSAAAWARWGEQGIAIALRPRVAAVVRVVDTAGGPIPEARVEWRPDDPRNVAVDFAQQGGVWTGALCRGPGVFRVALGDEAAKSWCAPAPAASRVGDDGPVTVQFVVRRAAEREVQVRDAVGQPIEAAKVEWVDPCGLALPVDFETVTDGRGPFGLGRATAGVDGRVRLRAPAGQPIAVRASADGFLPAVVEHVDAADSAPLVVTLQPCASVHGRVSFDRGAPDWTWHVQLLGASGLPCGDANAGTALDRNGNFVIRNAAPGRWWLMLSSNRSADGGCRERAVQPIDLRAGENAIVVDATGWSWSTIRARVEVDGRAWPNAAVALQRAEPEVASMLRSDVVARTDAGGRVRVAARRGRYRLGLQLQGPWMCYGPIVEIGEGGGEVRWDVATGNVELELVDAHGNPARGARIVLRNDPTDFPAPRVDADGDGVAQARVPVGSWQPAWFPTDAAPRASSRAAVLDDWFASLHTLQSIEVRAGETRRVRLELPDAAWRR